MNTWINKKTRFRIFLRRLKRPWFFLPILFLLLNMITRADLNIYYNAIMEKQGILSEYMQKSLHLIAEFIFFMIFLIITLGTMRFDSSYLIMIRCLSNLIFTLFLKDRLSETTASFVFVLTSLMSYLGVYFPLCLVWSQLSSRFVDGFETTGVGLCVFGVYNFGLLSNSWISQQLLALFEVKSGYLERLDGFFISMISIQVVLSFFSFLFFLMKEPRSSILKKRRSKQTLFDGVLGQNRLKS